MVPKSSRGGICHVRHQYAKGNNKYMKDYDKKIMIKRIIVS